jgi:hypothetical protein
MIRVTLGLIIGGLVLSYFGYQEYQVSEGAGEEPTPFELVKMEHGLSPPNNHVALGEHHALYEGLVFLYDAGHLGFDEPGLSTRVDNAYYPIVSKSHPHMKMLAEWEAAGGDPSEALAPERMQDIAVIVETRRFTTVGELPEQVRLEPGVSGLVVSDIESLDPDAQELLQETFPQVDFDKVIILEEGRQPSSPAASFGLMSLGGLLMLGGLGTGVFSLRS